jgi:CubicO group peptidase (beta-lactamase class C family)
LEALLQGWLAAFDASDPAAYQAFIAGRMPDAVPYIDDDLAVREASGGLTLLRSETTGPHEIVGRVKDRNWDRFSRVVLSTDEAGKMSDLNFRGTAAPEGFHVARQDQAGALRGLERKLGVEAAAGRFSGAVLVAHRGRVVLRRAYGMADYDRKTPATTSTRFCIGSMGKMFTAVAILQLVQGGRIQLSDVLATHIPDYPNAELARRVTIEHLLTHTGGTGDVFSPQYDGHAPSVTPADLIKLYGARAPAYAPGARFSYSNYGFVLLGAVVERVTGQPYDAYFRDRIFSVAGMASTSPAPKPSATTAVAYSGAFQTGLKPLAPYFGAPAGGGYSTVEDLHAFAAALAAHKLLDAERLALLTTPRVDAGSARQSLGLSVKSRNGQSCWGHGGAAPGVSSDFAVYPASGFTVAALSNRGYPHADNVAEYIGNRLPSV